MVPVENKAKHLSPVNHSAKAIHHHKCLVRASKEINCNKHNRTIQKIIRLDDISKEIIGKNNPNLPQISNHPYKYKIHVKIHVKIKA